MNETIINSINSARKIAIFSHINPDADALCSSFALKNIINNNFDYKSVDVFIDGEIGALYAPILRNEVVNPEPYNSYDMAFVLDCPNTARTGKYEEILNQIPNIINIDHHDTNSRFGTLNIVSAKASSTCELLYIIAKASNFELNNMIAKELYQGIITDTNCFTSTTITKRTHHVISELLGYKFDSDAIKEYYFKNNSAGKMRLLSKALQSLKFYKGERFTTMRIPNELFSKFDASFEDTLGIIDNGINISGTEVSAILIEKEPNKIYASLRSKGRVDVGEIAKEVGSRLGGSGGGGVQIAAFQAEGGLKEVEAALAESITPKLEDIENDDEIIF